MAFTDTGKDKIQQICDQLRKETLDPAEKEADKIVHEATERAHEIIARAKKEADAILESARSQIEKEREVLTSSLKIACKKSLSYLKQEIVTHLFVSDLNKRIQENMHGDDAVKAALEAIFATVEREGLGGSVTIALPKGASEKTILASLSESVKKRVGSQPVTIGNFIGGAQVKLHDEHLTLDLTDQAVIALMQKFLTTPFHKFLFEG